MCCEKVTIPDNAKENNQSACIKFKDLFSLLHEELNVGLGNGCIYFQYHVHYWQTRPTASGRRGGNGLREAIIKPM